MPTKTSRAGTDSRHNQIIDAMVERLGKIGGKAGRVRFRPAIRDAVGPHIYEEIDYALEGFTPDVWHIVHKPNGKPIIALYEVEDHHRLAVPKLRKYVDLWFAFDCEDEEIELRLFTVFNEVVSEIPLQTHYYKFLFDDAKEYGERNADT